MTGVDPTVAARVALLEDQLDDLIAEVGTLRQERDEMRELVWQLLVWLCERTELFDHARDLIARRWATRPAP